MSKIVSVSIFNIVIIDFDNINHRIFITTITDTITDTIADILVNTLVNSIRYYNK